MQVQEPKPMGVGSKLLSNLWISIVANPQTSITGIVAGIATFLSHFGVIIPKGMEWEIVTFAVFVIGLISRDGHAPTLQ